MAQSLFTDKLSIFCDKGVTNMKVDVIKHETYIEIRLIENDNIFTLFTCEITESDYHIYKNEQNLRVNYDRFIPILVGMLHKVKLNAEYNINLVQKGDKQILMQFVEQDDFKNIVKLELMLKKPDEFQYRKYLGDLLSRMEKDNVTLIKENKILREKAIKGDQDKISRIKYLEIENVEIKKRLELMNEELNSIEYKYNAEREEFYSDKSKLNELQKINAQLTYEMESYKKSNYKEKLEEQEKETNRWKNKIDETEEKYKNVLSELDEMKRSKRKLEKDLETEYGAKLSVDEIKSKLAHLEVRMKTYKTESKERKEKIDQLQSENKSLVKKLENAQNVYNHFLKTKVEDNDNVGNYSFEPENPNNK